jgi:xanthine dehydrogenase accessory factor
LGKKVKIQSEWEQASGWLKAGSKVALATVVKTWGSSPRPIGSALVIREDGVFEGSVSGGCVEGEVVLEALEILKTGKPQYLHFENDPNSVWSPGLSCGGKISIFVVLIKKENFGIFQGIVRDLKKRSPTLLITRLNDGKMHLLTQKEGKLDISNPFTETLGEEAKQCLKKRFSKLVNDNDQDYFINAILPRPKLFIIGAVHIAQSLVPIAHMTGFDVTLVDPREAFGNESRFPDHNLVVEWPDEFLEGDGLDSECAVITLAHDSKIDEAALKVALKSDCFYIGSLGSKRTHQTRISKLRGEGFSEKQLTRISGPVGLAIGAKTPQEISISILAEIINAMRKGGEKQD